VEQKFNYAIQLLKECFAEKSKDLHEEITKLKQVNINQKLQITNYASDLSEAKKRSKELEYQLNEQRKESLRTLDKYNKLLQYTQELEKFKKTIVTTVESESHFKSYDPIKEYEPVSKVGASQMYDSPQNNVDFDLNDLNNSRHFQETRTVTNSSTFKTAEFAIASTPAQAPPVMRFQVLDSKDSTIGTPGNPSASSLKSFPLKTGNATPVTPSLSKPTPSNSSSSSGKDYDSLVDSANELYSEIKEVLTPQQFTEFALNISKLNNAEQTVEETLENVGRLLKDHVTYLSRLERLIQAAADGGKSKK